MGPESSSPSSREEEVPGNIANTWTQAPPTKTSSTSVVIGLSIGVAGSFKLESIDEQT